MKDEKRLIQLEEKVAYIEKFLGDLDEVVQELAGRVRKHGEGVEQVRKLLQDHLSEAEGGQNDDPSAERPPHW